MSTEAEFSRLTMKIVSLDLALSCTGYGIREHDGAITVACFSPTTQHTVPRLIEIRDKIVTLTDGANLVLIENYSFGSRGQAVFSIGEMGGVVRVALAEAGHTVVEVAPASLKKSVCGKGNASKDEVLAAAIRRLNYQGYDHNEADALALLHMALSWYGLPEAVASMPQAHRDALKVVRWPSHSQLESHHVTHAQDERPILSA